MVMAPKEFGIGRGRVWICQDFFRNARLVQPGCGFIGLYKPENDRTKFMGRRCPSCGVKVTYQDTGEVCRIEMES